MTDTAEHFIDPATYGRMLHHITEHYGDITWYHLDGTECVAGWYAEGPQVGMCTKGGGAVTPWPQAT